MGDQEQATRPKLTEMEGESQLSGSGRKKALTLLVEMMIGKDWTKSEITST